MAMHVCFIASLTIRRFLENKQDAEENDKHLSSSTRQLPGIAVRPPPPGWLPPKDPMDYNKPRVFFDIEIDGQPAGRIVFELFTKQAGIHLC